MADDLASVGVNIRKYSGHRKVLCVGVVAGAKQGTLILNSIKDYKNAQSSPQ